MCCKLPERNPTGRPKRRVDAECGHVLIDRVVQRKQPLRARKENGTHTAREHQQPAILQATVNYMNGCLALLFDHRAVVWGVGRGWVRK